MGQSSLTLGIDGRVVHFDTMFPKLPSGSIYVALTGGVESTLVLHLVLEHYPNHKIIPCTYRFGDRRSWEFNNAKRMAAHFGISDRHIEAGYQKSSSIITEWIADPNIYFNRENDVFKLVRITDPTYVAGFTGKNTTLLDPEIIKPEEQEKYLVWFNVHRPFLSLDKHHIIDMYYQLGIDDLLAFTHTCQRLGNIQCGQCHACIERIDAFDRLGKKDPAIYLDDYDKLVDQVRRFFKIRWPRR